MLLRRFVLVLFTAGLAAAGDLDTEVASVLPKPEEERWLSIPWRTNLFQARLDAQAAGRPLLIWVMDGHVLGAT
ncbi:MAG: hypothetical protein FD180_1094 [Planctomycetota bacterium]|nr:MAG: hypothetical protein FD180_1094 [Planctomycetota bacterium]